MYSGTRLRGHEVPCSGGGQAKSGQIRRERIMQVTSQPPSLLFPSKHESFARLLKLAAQSLQISGQAYRVNGAAGLPREVVQQPPVSRCPALPGPTRTHTQLPHELAPVM